jgi:hypothetical protein
MNASHFPHWILLEPLYKSEIWMKWERPSDIEVQNGAFCVASKRFSNSGVEKLEGRGIGMESVEMMWVIRSSTLVVGVRESDL